LVLLHKKGVELDEVEFDSSGNIIDIKDK
jgi:hypothetical protein